MASLKAQRPPLNLVHNAGIDKAQHVDGLHKPCRGTNDFSFDMFHEEQFIYLFYTSVTAPGVWGISAVPVTITEVTASAVPEMQTFAMGLAGLGLLGAVARRRKIQVTRFYS